DDPWVAFARAVGRPDEAMHVTQLRAADPTLVDMRTLVLIGASSTRYLERPGQPPWLYTPRRLDEASRGGVDEASRGGVDEASRGGVDEAP
ncbi:MAG: hypothetical protein ABW321_05645, partial [Polyangiales bacterium]